MHPVLCADHVHKPQARAKERLPEAQPVRRDEIPVDRARFQPFRAEGFNEQADEDDGVVHHVVV